MDPSKIQAVTDWPVPDFGSALQRFLGFVNFYCRFFRNFSQVATPLTGLTSTKSRFVWSEAAQCVLSVFYAFESLKRLFTSTPILISPDPESQFIIEVDASDVGVGVVLDQKVHPCTFYSHQLLSAKRNYDVGNRELLAICLALQEWRHWLDGTSSLFIVWTDHRNLEYICSAKRLNSRQAHWAFFFRRFSFSISYRPGSKNIKLDALSCHFSSSEVRPTMETILPEVCVVGSVTWGVEQLVRKALSHTVVPRVSAHSAVLRWGHS